MFDALVLWFFVFDLFALLFQILSFCLKVLFFSLFCCEILFEACGTILEMWIYGNSQFFFVIKISPKISRWDIQKILGEVNFSTPSVLFIGCY